MGAARSAERLAPSMHYYSGCMTKTRLAMETGTADCGHEVRRGHAVVRRGKRWVCTGCSLPARTLTKPAVCPSCFRAFDVGNRMTLHDDGRWTHHNCTDQRWLAHVVVTDGYQSALG